MSDNFIHIRQITKFIITLQRPRRCGHEAERFNIHDEVEWNKIFSYVDSLSIGVQPVRLGLQ